MLRLNPIVAAIMPALTTNRMLDRVDDLVMKVL
jgi:hypothetical protein